MLIAFAKQLRELLVFTAIGSLLIVGLAPASFAAEGDDTSATEAESTSEDASSSSDDADDATPPTAAPSDGEARDEIFVTGSRISRDAFSSASPIQVIDGEVSRELGLFDAKELLQSSNVASGTQIDDSFTNFVLDNGIGAAQVSFRGLDPERTLLLINGKRMAPAGVGGAPTTPDLNLIPSIMIKRVESLLDGASSVYGSDAVAGVANVILRDDFDGFEAEASYSYPEAGGGVERTIAGAWGTEFDRGFIGAAAEYYDREALSVGDRADVFPCNQWREIGDDGNTYTLDYGLTPGTTIDTCKLDTYNRVFLDGDVFGLFGNIWYTPGQTNIDINNFSDTSIFSGFAYLNGTVFQQDLDNDGFPDIGLIDPDFDGLTNVDIKDKFYNFNGSSRYLDGDLVSPSERFSSYVFGEYELTDDLTFFGEVMYSRRKTEQYAPGAPFFPTVPGTNPTNPCNTNLYDLAGPTGNLNPNGTNCYEFITAFGGFYQHYIDDSDATPIVHIRGDRDQSTVEIDQMRVVGGLRGTLPNSDWAWEVYGIHSVSDGDETLTGIDDAALNYSLSTTVDNGSGQLVCGTDTDADDIPDSGDCVVVNFFAPSIFQEGGGTFATQAEADFLFTERTFHTEVKQTIFAATLAGDTVALPWNGNMIPVVLGMEYRKDEISSTGNDVATQGLLSFWFSDQGATGDRDLLEAFFETELALLENVPGAKELSLNLAGRWTEESNYGSAWTYSAKALYQPLEWLTFRGTYGTSYRAPNPREQFLNGTTGFLTVTDPCVVPTVARDTGIPNPTYNAGNDPRTQAILDSCYAAGVDPTDLGLVGNLSTSVSAEIVTGGNADLDEETSVSYTLGFIVDNVWFEDYTVRFAATYYNVEVEDAPEEPSVGFTIGDCHSADYMTSAFCSNIFRDSDGFIESVDTSFLNIGKLNSVGIDYNLLFITDVEWGSGFNLTVDLTATQLLEQIFELEGFEDDNAGETESPEWKASASVHMDFGDFRTSWRTRFIEGGTETNPGAANCGSGGANTVNTGVLCTPVFETGDYTIHSASVTWEPSTWSLTVGVENVFDRDPEFIDTNGVFGLSNIALGTGHDIFGRTIFGRVRSTF